MVTRRSGLAWAARRRGAGALADPDAATVRRVGWRLAALTVGLIAALVLVLGVTVYGTMQSILQNSLRQTVLLRAKGFLYSPLHFGSPGGSQPPSGSQPPGGSGGQPGGSGPFQKPPPYINGDVRIVIANQGLHVVPGFDPDAPGTLPDPGAARQVLSDHASQLWTTRQVDTFGPYLIYTHPIRFVPQSGGAVVAGVLQAFISQQQYLNSLHSLLVVLLGVSAAGLLAAAAISALLARRALGPIQRALRRQRDFVADAAHELRTPLAIQRTAMELGLASEAVAEQQGAIEQALSQNVHLARLVDSLSLLARADSGAVTLERQPLDLARLASEAAGGVAILAEERGVRLSFEAPGEVRVRGDAGRLRQLLLILLDNALKFTPDSGCIAVKITRQGEQARVQVQDNGPGIASADLPHLFERFYRADKARSGGGTGLGLAIGRWIAEAHGGRIAAANAPEGGALFTVTLPLASS